MCAAQEGSSECVTALLAVESIEVNSRDKVWCGSASAHANNCVFCGGVVVGAHAAMWLGTMDSARLTPLLATFQNGKTALMCAAQTGSAECVAGLLAAGDIDVHAHDNVRDIDGSKQMQICRLLCGLVPT